MKLKFLLAFFFIGGILGACREQDPEPQLSIEDQRTNLIKVRIAEAMDDFYFWRLNMPEIASPTLFPSFQELVDALIYKPIDRWTYVTSTEEFNALTRQGQFAGHGYIQSIDANGDIRVGAVFKDSPAERAGFRRSTQILKVNGQDVQTLLANNTFTQAMGAREIGVSNTFQIRQSDGSESTVTVGKEIVTQNTVMHHEIFELSNGKKVGYLVFLAFRESSINELRPVFSAFESAGITDLILDLRYNGGGFINVAQFLANILAPPSARGQIFFRDTFNDRQKAREREVRFSTGEFSLNLNALIALTGPGTASASELIINGLDPFLDVKLVGEQTGGKPVGALVIGIAEQTLVPISFKAVNANGVGDYYDGLPVDRNAADGLDRNWGDPEESRLKEALYYLENGSFRTDFNARMLSYRHWLANRNMLNGFQAEIGAF